ncbi:hypothetical protein PR202_ga04575 [Eleusine coracana subsp. coracana]|uniref:Uncharacterized protein n=1 Tax=Eleusine coracana subsp. coracana TaxID=191504 RepID=A0AAV5BRX6_ELECO|nr:hypothetical protein PR202_ga04575 [Eleusine coracana subsp. coracana]
MASSSTAAADDLENYLALGLTVSQSKKKGADFFNNAYYGKVGGISTREMNKLELDLLFSLDFRLKVNVETFRSYCLQLEKEALTLVLEKPIHVQASNGIKHLSFNNNVDETCKHELVHERYSSRALQGCS